MLYFVKKFHPEMYLVPLPLTSQGAFRARELCVEARREVTCIKKERWLSGYRTDIDKQRTRLFLLVRLDTKERKLKRRGRETLSVSLCLCLCLCVSLTPPPPKKKENRRKKKRKKRRRLLNKRFQNVYFNTFCLWQKC